MGEITKDELRERLGNIDQIRDIIFGAHLREFNGRFEKLESGFTTLQEDMREHIENVKNSLSAELKTAVDSFEKKLKSLNLTVQEEGTDLRQQIDRLNRKFSNSIEALDETVDNQNNAIREELSQTRDKLQEDVRTLKAHVLDELDRQFSMLREVKVSKDDMAEILFELGMRLKGTEFVPELKEAADTQVYTDIELSEQKRSVAAAVKSTRPKPQTNI